MSTTPITTTTTAAGVTPRLNIIFHGLMAFREAGPQYYDVMIPQPGNSCHEAKYGNPLLSPQSPLDGLQDFPKERHFYQLEGVRDGGFTGAKPHSTHAVVLRNKLLVPQAGGVRTVLRVPKPDLIRYYRGGETRGRNLCGEGSHPVLTAHPDIVHEVAVFSYFYFSNPAIVGPPESYKIPQLGAYWNLCVYSQPLAPCPVSDSDLFGGMFTLKDTGKPLRIEFALPEVQSDGAPQTTSIGVSNMELLGLRELPGVITLQTGDPGACIPAFTCDDCD